MRRRRVSASDDPLIRRARQATLEGDRLVAKTVRPGSDEAPASRTAVLATVSDLVVLLRELMDERNRLAAELETIDRRCRAASAYRTAGALYALPPRVKRS